MADRNLYEDYRRQGRDDEYRTERQRERASHRYGLEDRSWDDAPSGGYPEPERYGAHRRRGYASADYGDYRGRSDGWGESGFRAGESGDRPGRQSAGRWADRPGYRQGEYRGEPGGRRFTGQGYSSFGSDYGQGGHGGFGSGGHDGVSQTGGSAGMTGTGHAAYGYQEGGYAPGAQIWEGDGQDVASGYQSRHHDFEPDYLHWRDGQMRDLDRDYQAWRDERRQKFSREFDNWRNQRRTQGAQSQGATLSQAVGAYGTPGASSDGDAGGTLQSNPQVTRVAGAEEAKKKN